MSFINTLQNRSDLTSEQKSELAQQEIQSYQSRIEQYGVPGSEQYNRQPKYIKTLVQKLIKNQRAIKNTSWYETPQQYKASKATYSKTEEGYVKNVSENVATRQYKRQYGTVSSFPGTREQLNTIRAAKAGYSGKERGAEQAAKLRAVAGGREDTGFGKLLLKRAGELEGTSPEKYMAHYVQKRGEEGSIGFGIDIGRPNKEELGVLNPKGSKFIQAAEYPYSPFQSKPISELQPKAGYKPPKSAELNIVLSNAKTKGGFTKLAEQRYKEARAFESNAGYTAAITKPLGTDKSITYTVSEEDKSFWEKSTAKLTQWNYKASSWLGNTWVGKELDKSIQDFSNVSYITESTTKRTLNSKTANTYKVLAAGWVEQERGLLFKGKNKGAKLSSNIETIKGVAIKTSSVPSEFATGYLTGLRRQPVTTGVTTAAYFSLPLASKVISKVFTAGNTTVFGPNYSAFLGKQVAPAISATLAAGYGTTVAVRSAINEKPFRELGYISSTELTPMFAGSIAGQKFFSYAETKFLKRQYNPKYYQPYKTTSKAHFEGREPYPLVKSKGGSLAYRQYKDFVDSKKGLPIEYENKAKLIFEGGGNKASFVWKASGESWGDKINLQPSGNYELQGTYFGAKLSTNFLRLGDSYSYYPTGDILYPYPSPRAIRQFTLGFEPKNIKSVSKANEFLISGKAKKGFIYTFSTKTEQEGVMIAGTESNLIDVPYYTSIPSPKQIAKFEVINRKGFPEYVRRVEKFSITKPSTYWDKITGKKAGSIKKFGFKGVGKEVLIEVRGTPEQAAQAPALDKGALAKVLGYGGSSSSARIGGSYYLSTPQAMGLGIVSSYPRSRGSVSYSITSNLSRTSSRPYSISSRVSRYGSSPSSVSSSLSSSSGSSGGSSSSSSFASSIGSSPASSTASSSSSSTSIINTSTITYPKLPTKVQGFLKPKKRKEQLVTFNPKYFASVEASALNIRGRKPSKFQLAAGLNIRPILRGM